MALQAVVVDDEQLARDELCYLLGQAGGVEIAGQAGSGPEALSVINRVEPDIVFLDVQMPGLSGFEVARRLLEDETETHIIFVTAFDQYAIEAFEVNAVDYLLKPVDPARLEIALHRARQRVERDRPVNDELERIVQLVTERQQRRERLAIKVDERLLLVQAHEIIYASMAEDGITVVTTSVTGTSNYRTLDELHGHLDPAIFWRVHRSHLVNINKIKEIVPWFSRNYMLKMKDAKGSEIPVSRTQTRRLREYLKL
ncbi:MAG TPA: LytTR family DNA-binding domain-containing protein [Vicinamibacterales bacterium]|jgi:two-component system LytT family response regulator/two-component system response regulator LytT